MWFLLLKLDTDGETQIWYYLLFFSPVHIILESFYYTSENSWKLFLNFNWICMFVEMIKFSSACYFHSWRIYLLEMASWRSNSNFYLFPFQLQSWDWTLSTVVPGLLRMLELPIAESFTFAIVILLGQIGRSVTVLLLNIKAQSYFFFF